MGQYYTTPIIQCQFPCARAIGMSTYMNMNIKNKKNSKRKTFEKRIGEIP